MKKKKKELKQEKKSAQSDNRKWSRRRRRRKRGGSGGMVLPQHFQRVSLVDLDATFGTVVAVLEVLHDAALTD